MSSAAWKRATRSSMPGVIWNAGAGRWEVTLHVPGRTKVLQCTFRPAAAKPSPEQVERARQRAEAWRWRKELYVVCVDGTPAVHDEANPAKGQHRGRDTAKGELKKEVKLEAKREVKRELVGQKGGAAPKDAMAKRARAKRRKRAAAATLSSAALKRRGAQGPRPEPGIDDLAALVRAAAPSRTLSSNHLPDGPHEAPLFLAVPSTPRRATRPRARLSIPPEAPSSTAGPSKPHRAKCLQVPPEAPTSAAEPSTPQRAPCLDVSPSGTPGCERAGGLGDEVAGAAPAAEAPPPAALLPTAPSVATPVRPRRRLRFKGGIRPLERSCRSPHERLRPQLRLRGKRKAADVEFGEVPDGGAGCRRLDVEGKTAYADPNEAVVQEPIVAYPAADAESRGDDGSANFGLVPFGDKALTGCSMDAFQLGLVAANGLGGVIWDESSRWQVKVVAGGREYRSYFKPKDDTEDEIELARDKAHAYLQWGVTLAAFEAAMGHLPGGGCAGRRSALARAGIAAL
mmetsp:Transcript_81288/g.263645  ORF Transcript_81288/g.263645 Transcript_81288/m.263645 type:complete len:513 (+) Transcript_81288:221-1759(+)